MQRIYLPHTRFGETLEISEFSLYHQITRVMRARVGQEFVFFDGVKLQDYIYEIKSIDAKKVVFLQKEVIVKHTDISLELHLYQALPNKLEKLEYIIQKSCEVGYQSITFFQAERSQILVLSENKKERLKKIAIEAIEQCGGNTIPEIEFIANLSFSCSRDTSLQLSPARGESESHCSFSSPSRRGLGEVSRETEFDTLSLFCHTSGLSSRKLTDICFDDIQHINVLVGPEGGFCETEVERFTQAGMQQIYFGTRILRTETVAPLLGFYISQKKEA